jgi:glycosyltransferase involved in cell wall biosynthesis
MLLVDALYINVGGGKVLLDYLIRKLNTSGEAVHYLLDERIRDSHEPVDNGTVEYQRASIPGRLLFYTRNKSRFQRVLCFGNLPPSIKINAEVYTYFHQPLFLEFSKELPLLQRILLSLKITYLRFLKMNTDYWMVQTSMIAAKLAKKYSIPNPEKAIRLMPFYPSLAKVASVGIRRDNCFIYVSSGEAHKNHHRLLEAFAVFFDSNKTGELHLTVEKRFTDVYEKIRQLQDSGYPVINHGMIPHKDLKVLYDESTYLIYPSLAESFGLGIIEAIECGCKVIGADRPYLHAVCIPSEVFDPMSVHDISSALQKATEHQLPASKQLVFDNIDMLVKILTGNPVNR